MDEALGNQDGIGFTVLVVKVTPQADIARGSDEIYQASDDSWVGEKGYQKEDGTWQRARAFIGQDGDQYRRYSQRGIYRRYPGGHHGPRAGWTARGNRDEFSHATVGHGTAAADLERLGLRRDRSL